ncbi:glycerophosphodiester phosphodiesterase [Aquibacillus sp. 3ASR75-54]|uniref:Glycerophosphodiester phosphodiesterase n=1 Tax=Aquibacillus salsiterrae TaxID=2950439 RepID=A0A9X3WBX3_9BACI|nr:glycerophosphodiester phosphodiesterase [Aquibacillus salsiterrae]MDC3415446.1 glycerophosphodiester phosphodiesterase [Aquibacillus salsiterrae]
MKTIIYAHRGASKLAPENTMPAFELAYKMGAEGIETDVQLTKDNVPVLIHDENVRRTTNGTGFLLDYTLAELKQLDAGSWFSDQYRGTSIPTLHEFLQWVQDKHIKINLELKNNIIDYKDLEKIVYDHLEAFNLLDRTVISSFNSASIHQVGLIDESVTTGFLTSQKIKDLIDFAKDQGARGLHIKYRMLNPSIVKEAHLNNLYVAVYTVNRPIQLRRCFRLSCDAIFTDVPNIAKQTRDMLS